MLVRSRSLFRPSRWASPTVTDRALGPRLTRLWLATALSNMADGALLVGAPLLVVTFTRSPLLVALTSSLAMAPWLVVPLLAGVFADRHDPRIIIAARLRRWPAHGRMSTAAPPAKLHSSPEGHTQVTRPSSRSR